MLSGLTIRDEVNINGEIGISFTGLRPGEKLYEELLIGENPEPTRHEKIFRANEELVPWSDLRAALDVLRKAIEEDDYDAVRRTLLDTVQGYKPSNEIVDLLYEQNGLAKK